MSKEEKKKTTRKRKVGRPKMPILNPKQRMFIDQYLMNGNNMREAYSVAYDRSLEGLDDKGLNRIDVCASTLFAKPHVQSYMNERIRRAGYKKGITKEKLLEHMANIAFGNIAVLMAKLQVEMDPVTEKFSINAEGLTEDEQKLIQQLDFDPNTGRIKMQGYRADAMLVKLYEMLGYSKEEKDNTSINIVWEEKKNYKDPNLIEHKGDNEE
jgi:phage terminase small subunit